MTQRLPTYFVSHGGGPWPWVPEMATALQQLADALADMPRQIGQVPEAVLLVTAHWEAPVFTLGAHPHPGMVYDYGGFPPHTYEIVYPAPGAPQLARRVHDLVASARLPVAMDPVRGYDHGTFVPLAVMYPQADVPVLQVSLRHGLDPAEHLAFGRALAPLRDEGVLIVGSGLSYHNLGAFGPRARAPSEAFDAWLHDTLGAPPSDRASRLTAWSSAPGARLAHPREEHLLPLMVAVGAAGDDGATCVYHERDLFGGITASSFRFNSPDMTLMTERILLLGATGRTGQLVLDEALQRGFKVVALVRRPQALKQTDPRLTVVTGNPSSASDIENAMKGCDAVIGALNNNRMSDAPWAKPVSPPGFMTGAMRNVLAAAHTLGVRRVVLMSAAGAGDSFGDMPWIMRWLVRKTNLAHTYRDHDEQEALLKASGLDWTILRPVGLHDGEPRGELVFSVQQQPKPGMRIARRSVARQLVACLTDHASIATAPVLSER
jgi:aromatic ring-opening dioxygenase catalytic subunit (LigB family)/uncharacterized protein YbjT (DUF2867 family)